MFTIIKSSTFSNWIKNLKDRQAIARINARISRIKSGNLGDTKSVGEGIFELRITYGPGYRVYYVKKGIFIIVLLCGGDKSSQKKDIIKARKIAEFWRKSNE